MTTPKTDALMALADRYAFHIPGSQHSDEARAVLLAALQEQAREGEGEQEPIARIMFNDDGRKTDNLIDCDLPVGTLLYAAPQPAQPSEPAQPVAQPNIQNQIVKDISRHEPCHTCAHYQQGKLPGVRIHDETCYECRSYWGNKWEAA